MLGIGESQEGCWGGGGRQRAGLSGWALPGCRQDGTGSGQGSPDLAATRLRPVSDALPPPNLPLALP